MIPSPNLVWVVLCVSLGFSAWAGADSTDPSCDTADPSHGVLANMLDAHAAVSYSGSLLLERMGERQFLTVSWPIGPEEGGLRTMNSAVNPKLRSWPAPAGSAGRLCDLLEVYAPSVEPGRVIAGRSTQRLTLKPKDTLRLGHVIDVDQRTGVVLGMLTVAADGKALERYEFAQINLNPVEADSTQNAPSALSQKKSRLASQATVLPGYFVISEEVSRGSFVVSDGLAMASVFVEPLPLSAPVGEGLVTHGATLTYTRGVRTAAGGMLISVLGEIPLVTARLLADAVRPSGDGP
jgi:hypothetical protein